MENVYSRIGKKIREIRKRQKMTLEELSNRADLDWSFVARIETGKGIPSIRSLVKISKALNISIGDLFSKQVPSQDKLLEREITSIIQNLKPTDKLRIIQILKLILSIPIKLR